MATCLTWGTYKQQLKSSLLSYVTFSLPMTVHLSPTHWQMYSHCLPRFSTLLNALVLQSAKRRLRPCFSRFHHLQLQQRRWHPIFNGLTKRSRCDNYGPALNSGWSYLERNSESWVTTLSVYSFRVTTARAWNSLPTSVTTATSLASFIKQLKTFLFTKSFPLF